MLAGRMSSLQGSHVTPIFSPTMNASDLCVQQLIDKAPTITKSCVVSMTPDALLQGVTVRWTPPVGQFGGLDKLGSGCRHAAN
jgi:hypothetical protein